METKKFLLILIFSVILVCGEAGVSKVDLEKFPANLTRSGRLLSIFSSNKDENNPEVCRDGENTGVCQSSSKCKTKGGRSFSGSACSTNREVCCRIEARCPKTLTEPCIIKSSGTLVINEENNSNYRRLYRFRKPKGVCQLRLDFDLFDLAPAGDQGDCNAESLQISGYNTGFSICGNNTGNHAFIPFDVANTIDMSVKIQTTTSRYRIRSTFIECKSEKRAPKHCLQYFTTLEGTVRSFGFGKQSNNMDYSVCIKAADGMNRIQWSACAGVANSFYISGNPHPDKTGPAEGKDCPADWVQIYGGNRYCGTRFTTVTSTIKPFLMNVRFDGREGATVSLPNDPSQCNGPIPGDGDFLGADYDCRVAQDGICTCEVVMRPPGGPIPAPMFDIANTGFCLEYMQLP